MTETRAVQDLKALVKQNDAVSQLNAVNGLLSLNGGKPTTPDALRRLHVSRSVVQNARTETAPTKKPAAPTGDNALADAMLKELTT